MEKQNIVLLSGWHHNFANDKKFILKLCEKYNVKIICLPGHGGLPDTSQARSMTFLAKYVKDELERSKITDFTFLAFSMGCQIALKYTQIYNTSQRSILVAPTFKPFNHKVPPLLRVILKFKPLIQLIALSKDLKVKIVAFALQSAGDLSEGNNKNSQLSEDDLTRTGITIDGAFNTLIALVTDFVNPELYLKNLKIIYGSKDLLREIPKSRGYKIEIIDGVGHYFFNSRINEVIDHINDFVTTR